MFSPSVREVIDRAGPRQPVVLIIRIDDKMNASEVAAISDVSERREYINKYYSRLKQPLLCGVKSLSDVKIVNTLKGTNQMVVAASADVWKRYIEHPPAVFEDRGLTLSANDTEITL